MNRQFISALWEMIEPILEPEGIELVEVEFKPQGGTAMLRLYIDVPGGVTFEDCELVSRQVGALLDIKDLIPHSYTLEVSSPGINRVLRKEKDFVNYSGSPVRLRTSRKIEGRRNFSGTLKGVMNSRIILDTDGGRVEIDPDDIENARLDLSEMELMRKDLRKGTLKTGD
jgi:ribosome maturation factor RimP